MPNPAANSTHSRNEYLLAAFAAISFIALRLAGLAKGPELDDHDSNGYIEYAEIWGSGDWSAIVNMNPDATFFYPFLMAVFSNLTGGYDSAGRLVSLLASFLTLAAIYVLARKIAGVLAAAIAVLLIAFNPYFVRFSYSILSEPLYVVLICLLLTSFIGQLRRPTVRSGAMMGLIASLAFLTRIEGILFLAAIPFFQLAHRMVANRDISWTRTGNSMLAFVAVFSLLAIPQIWRVSYVMDTVSLNGRSVWSILLNNPDGKSSDEKIYGLDFDPGVTNLRYLQDNPEAVASLMQNTGYVDTLVSYLRKAIRNLEILHNTHLVALVGIPFLAFSVIGFIALIRAGRAEEVVLILGFLATCIVAPLLHNVTLRHIAVIAPIMAVFAGAGAVDAGRALGDHVLNHRFRATIFGLAVLALASYLPDLARLYSGPDDANHEYSWESLQPPVEILKRAIVEDGRVPRVLARKTYLPKFADAEMVRAPYTDLSGLLRYIQLNDVHFLFYSERNLRSFPFAQAIDSPDWHRHFDLLYSGRDENGFALALYALRPPTAK